MGELVMMGDLHRHRKSIPATEASIIAQAALKAFRFGRRLPEVKSAGGWEKRIVRYLEPFGVILVLRGSDRLGFYFADFRISRCGEKVFSAEWSKKELRQFRISHFVRGEWEQEFLAS